MSVTTAVAELKADAEAKMRDALKAVNALNTAINVDRAWGHDDYKDTYKARVSHTLVKMTNLTVEFEG